MPQERGDGKPAGTVDGMTTENPRLPQDADRVRIAPNAGFAVLQVITTAATLFLLYRYLLSTLGADALGVWSLVAAAASLAAVSSLGLTGGTVRFVSKYLAVGDRAKAGSAAETATISIGATMAVATLLFWPLASWVVALLVPIRWLEEAQELVPFTLAALWLASTAGAVLAGLDGCHRITTRSVVTMATQPLLLVLTVWWVPSLGLKGVATAQLVQYGVWLVLGWILLRRQLPTMSRVPHRWSLAMFQEMWRYGLNFQAISIMTMLLDPLAKALLSSFGGLSAVAYFEMANRMVSQARLLIASANQVLVPYYSKVAETSRERLRGVYEQNLQLTVLLSTLVFGSLVPLLPLVSELWIGRLQPQFLFFSVVLLLGWLANAVATPAYFANLGGGWISRNLYAHLAQSGSMAVLGVMGGAVAGARGVAFAYMLALFVGSGVLLATIHRSEHIAVSSLFSKTDVMALGGCALVAAGGLVFSLWLFVAGEQIVATVAAVMGVIAVVVVLLVSRPELLVMVKGLVASRASSTH